MRTLCEVVPRARRESVVRARAMNHAQPPAALRQSGRCGWGRQEPLRGFHFVKKACLSAPADDKSKDPDLTACSRHPKVCNRKLGHVHCKSRRHPSQIFSPPDGEALSGRRSRREPATACKVPRSTRGYHAFVRSPAGAAQDNAREEVLTRGRSQARHPRADTCSDIMIATSQPLRSVHEPPFPNRAQRIANTIRSPTLTATTCGSDRIPNPSEDPPDLYFH